MNDLDYFLNHIKNHADWMLIEVGDGYTASILEEAMEEIKRLYALNERIKLYMLEKAVEVVEEKVSSWSIAAAEECVAALVKMKDDTVA